MGTAVLGTILFVGLYDNTEVAVADTGAPAEVSTQIAQIVEQSAGPAIPGLANPPGSPEIQAASSQAFSDALEHTAYYAAGFLMLGLLSTLKLPPGQSYGAKREDESELIRDFE
jgi:hypothetical protein